MARIHIAGASGSGTTTMGQALAAQLGCPQHDADDYYWLPTDLPYTDKRPARERNAQLWKSLASGRDWVLSGSVDGWAAGVEDLLDLVVFLWVPTELRLGCLQAREEVTFGVEAISEGGTQYVLYREFIDWAARYDSAGLEQRSRAKHETWMAELKCPILRIEGDTTTDDRVSLAIERLELMEPAGDSS